METYREFNSSYEFEVLEEIPGSGHEAVEFLPAGRQTAERRCLISVDLGERTWIGNFGGSDNCGTGVDLAATCPHSLQLCVGVCGVIYIVNVSAPDDFSSLSGEPVVDFQISANSGVMAFVGYTKIWLLEQSGRLLHSDRLSWDGFREIQLSENRVEGLAWFPWKDEWEKFSEPFDHFSPV